MSPSSSSLDMSCLVISPTKRLLSRKAGGEGGEGDGERVHRDEEGDGDEMGDEDEREGKRD